MNAVATSRIAACFARLRGAGRSALIPFVTAGDPNPAATVALMHALVAAGADLIELGVPFSDPMADGPIIQAAHERALARGVHLVQVLDWVAEFRVRDPHTPVVLMGYLNPVEVIGHREFAAQARQAGVDGVLWVDWPLEARAQHACAYAQAGVAIISMVAPTTAPERLQAVAAQAEGFVYCVAFAGITGGDQGFERQVCARARALRALAPVPVAIGFGIKLAEQASRLAGCADGVIIGSALVERLAGVVEPQDVVAVAREFLSPFRRALDSRVSQSEGDMPVLDATSGNASPGRGNAP